MKLFQPKETYRSLRGGFRLPPGGSQGQNPAAGAVVYYSFKEKPKDEVTLEFLDNVRPADSQILEQSAAEKKDSRSEEEDDFAPACRMPIACRPKPV